jgi:hypothetical protein
MEISVNESAANHPNRFLADLTQAMRSTAESALQSTTDQCHADAKAYVEQLHARTEDEADGLRKAAEADVATIRERSKARVERIRHETEERTSRRRELLEQELTEYNSAIELEVESVQARVAAFEQEVGQFFEQLLQGADPTIFASMASQMPDTPAFSDLDREALANEFRVKREAAERAEMAAVREAPQAAASAEEAPAEELPDHWWMDSPAALASRTHAEEPK